MRLNRLRLVALEIRLLAVTLALVACPLFATAQVVTQHNDASRTGQNLSETILNTSNVHVNAFGKLFARTVDGQIYAQPLYVPNLTIQGGMHNVVFVATMHNSVYAFDADNPSASAALWHVNLGTPVPSQDISSTYSDITPEIGILSTPVIDTAGGTIYVVAKTKTVSNSTYHFQLHALDILTGAEKFGGPVEIAPTVSGTGDGSVGGQVALGPLYHLNRPGLLLMGGVVYLAFGSVGDIFPYHGWILGYNASTLRPAGVFNVTPNGSDGGIWQGGSGLTADAAGNIYTMVGNGTFDAATSGIDYGDSFLKLSTTSGLAVTDYFTPFNQAALSAADADLGSGGPMLIPGTGLIVGIGKDGVLRLINTSNMGKFNASTNNDVQEFQVLSGALPFMGGTIYWNSPNNGPMIYLWGPGDFLKAFKFTGSSIQTTPVSQSSVTEFAGYSNTVPMSLSANGNQAGTGIVWASAADVQDANQQTVTGVLRAFDATNLSVELWNSKQNAARDGVGNYAKFSPPTVANGKVYLATFSNQLLVYGLVGLAVDTTILPNGVVGTAYSQTLLASGGQTPYTWSITAGSLPAGLALDPSTGVISGTPTATGSSTFTVQVQDATLAIAAWSLGITVTLTAPTLAIDATVSADAGATGTATTTPTLTTTAANELLVAFVAAADTGTSTKTVVSSLTGLGLTWTKATGTNSSGDTEIWWAYAATTVNGTVTVTINQVCARSITVVAFQGAGSGADAIGATAGTSRSGALPTASLVTTRANSWVFGTGNEYNGAFNVAVGANQTLAHQYLSTATGDTFWVQRQNAVTPAAGTTVTINDTAPAGAGNLALIEIRPTAGSAPPPQTLAIDATVSADSATTGTTITTPTLTTAAANELLVAFIGASGPTTGTNTTVTGVTNTGGALTWTRAVRTNGQRGTAEIWWAYATSTFVGTVTATMSRSVSSRSISVASFTGTASGAGAIGATGGGSASSGAPTASLVTTRANSWVFGVGNDRGRAVGRTLGTGQTMVHQYLATATADTYWVQRRNSSTPTAGTTVIINDTAPTTDRYNLSIVEIRTP